jgi:hypothetical protein
MDNSQSFAEDALRNIEVSDLFPTYALGSMGPSFNASG